MIDKVFSQELIDLITCPQDCDINNINRELIELAVAGCYIAVRKNILWIVGENENFREKEEKLKLWLTFLGAEDVDINLYTAPFADPYIDNSCDLNVTGNKIKTISTILNKRRAIFITTLSALNIKIEAKTELDNFFLDTAMGEEISRDDFTNKLAVMGYRARNIVEDRGDMAWRGSIVDVFPIDKKEPVRVEIEGDRIISIRVFDPDTQKSRKKIEQVRFPLPGFFLHYDNCRDYFNNAQESMSYLPDLLGDLKIVVSDRRKIRDEFAKLMEHYEKIYRIALDQDKEIEKVADIFSFPFEKEKTLSINDTYDTVSGNPELEKMPRSISEFNFGDISVIKDKIENRGYRLFVLSREKNIGKNLQENFADFVFMNMRLPVSFENKKTACLFITDRHYRHFEKFEKLEELDKAKESKSDNLVREIQVNDFVVHSKHGIGKFTGFKRLRFEGEMSEFLKIEYLKQEFLYVPVYELDELSKYMAFEGISPRLDKMGGNSWALKQKRAQKSIITFARELLDLYALRKTIKGTGYTKDSEWEDDLENSFKYVETEDQKRAIKETTADLEAEFPMDRLICGDVSFGKTEVAIRAALRVVTGGKQVAFLCPTTILAHQHYNTFKKRFAPYPINIAMLSRMVSQKEKKVIYKALEEGRVDIVIGTHSLIAKELKFKSLGLYIIDEEQRFGVFQKEKLKKNREDVDFLSLSATPIPRTLSLSMAGLQDISTIQSPPIGRMAIKNYVGYFSKEILTSAVLNEMEREGLVFIVYNNIDKLYTFKEDVQKWLPEVPAAVIHARMKGEEVERNLMDFINKKFRVLLSTTIIENGIDIPDVNTLIVIDADRFGLTQLYQLRGRIGRGNRQAFSYFLVRSMDITDKARARLDAIRDFADLGSGYKLAEFDLQLRGAGSLLGNRQHGHIEALGFDYYHRLLTETIKELKGEKEKREEAKISINFSYSIDPGYIKDSAERIHFYRKILEAEEFEQIDELRADIEDRFGRMPVSIEKIFFAGTIRVLVRKFNFEKVDVFLDRLVITFAGPNEKEELLRENSAVEFTTEEEDEKTTAFYFSDYLKFIDEFSDLCINAASTVE
jgi:transcription-repair coupling factor (superfamily II helicase)